MVVIFHSCKEEVPKEIEIDPENGVLVEVEHAAGDNWEATDNFLPLPFNVARVGSEEVFVLSERIKPGERLNVKPLGAINIMRNDSLKTYVVSIPSKSKYESFSMEDFDEFSTVYSGAKWIVEQYLLNRENSFNVKLKSWENENYAIKYLLK